MGTSIFNNEYSEQLKFEYGKLFDNIDNNEFYGVIKQYVKDADDIINETFAFNNPWDMEQCNKPYNVLGKNWQKSPNGDPEWVYMLSRMEYINKLVFAWLYTHDDKYINKWFEFVIDKWYAKYSKIKTHRKLNDFLGKVKLKLKIVGKADTNRTLDVAIRDYNLIVGISIINAFSIADSARVETLLGFLQNDDEFLSKNHIEFDDTSNWGIIILCARLVCSYIRNDSLWLNSDKHKQMLAKLETMMKCQISESGTHIENSTMYEVQVVIFVLRVIYWAEKRNCEIPYSIINLAKSIVTYIKTITRPDNYQWMYGDSDDTEMSSFFILAQNVLHTDEFCDNIVSVNDFLLLADMPEAISKALKLCINDKEQIQHKISCTQFTGEHAAVMRDGNDMVVCFNGNHTSGHSHADSGSIVYYAYDIPILIDCGRYSYVNCNIRRTLKGVFAHNCVTVDNSMEWQVSDAWVFNTKTDNANMKSAQTDEFCIVKMVYQSSFINAKFSRIVIMRKKQLFVISGVKYQGNHILKEYYNFDKNISIQIENNTISLNTEKLNLYLNKPCNCEVTKNKSLISQHYNIVEDSYNIMLAHNFEDYGFNAVLINNALADVCCNIVDEHVNVNFNDIFVTFDKNSAFECDEKFNITINIKEKEFSL